MVSVTYYCPYCGALTSLERDAYMADKCVTKEPLDGWEYASTTDEYEDADGVEFVCIGDAEDDPDAGCGRTFYLSFVKFEGGEPVDHRVPDIDRPRFDFLR
ncbi:hypothetical protein [Haloarchaeobius litoreus]|uniref:DUF7969 domain-containing protein n=1 Tax=Haloarchaeobius litoreus TaxID=755306 RepID=A0ABD6DHF6_9EURY|nr:hypothetical protein [Haloarchaeobius litoreus]